MAPLARCQGSLLAARFALCAPLHQRGAYRTTLPLDFRSTPEADVSLRHGVCRKGPCVDGSELARRIFTLQAWSVQPCVRPLSAVHMTAGHNALRGSGPGQQLAFKNAMAQVGCPDRRIDWPCVTCCSPSQPSHHATVLWRDLVRPAVRPDNCIARP